MTDNNVVRFKTEVNDILADVADDTPDIVVVFAYNKRDDSFTIYRSAMPNMTYMLGALERMKNSILNGGASW